MTSARVIVWSVALVGLTAALIASGHLVNKHFGGTLPGCGPASGCDALDRSAWSRVRLPGGVAWSVAFVGVAYFAGMMAAWVMSWKRVGRVIGVIAVVGLMDSMVFAGVMMYLKTWCLYCAATHTANGIFVAAAWATIVLDARKERRAMAEQKFSALGRRIVAGLARPGPIGFAIVFGATSIVLGVANAGYEARRAEAAEAERAKSVAAIVSGGEGVPNEGVTVIEVQPPAPSDRWGAGGFSGRYRKGPESAAIRVVVLTDFQCPDCKRVEGEILAAMKGLEAVGVTASLSIKHFPMCKDCNKYVSQTIHGNACFGARAAEAAGILGGDEAFFKFVDWLFEVDGKFETKEILARGVSRAGLSVGVEAFVAVMESAETLKRVQADVEDGMALGVYFTPMVFINGVEMKGWQVPGAVKKTIEEVAAAKPTPVAKTATGDRPVLAAQRFIDDWKEQPPAREFMPDEPAWSTGATPDFAPPDASKDPKRVEVIVFGDYLDVATAKFDGELRAAMKDGRGNVRYTFRHYPLNPECNPALPPNMNKSMIRAGSCVASRAAEAAGKVGGRDAYWKMHEWLLKNQSGVSVESVKQAAAAQGLDAAGFAAAIASAEIASAIRDDALAGQLAGLKNMPTVFVNGKQVPRPLRDGDNVIKRIIDEAGKASAK